MSQTNGKIGKVWGALWRPLAGAVGLVALVVWSSGALSERTRPGTVEVQAGIALPANARTITVKGERAPAPVQVVGSVVPERRVNLSARIPAALQTLEVSAGSVVTNGQRVATLDDRSLREQRAAAEALLRQAETEYARTRQLFDKSATTDQARVAALAQLEAARAQFEQASVMLGYATVVSPLSGIVVDRRVEAGDLAAPGMVLMSIYDPTRMRFEVPVPVRLLPDFPLGREMEVSLDGIAQPVKGTVTEIVSEIDPLTRTRKVKLQLGAAATALLPGTYGQVTVAGEVHDTLWVPAGAVYQVGQQELVQVVVGERVIRRIVHTAVRQDGRVEILSGLGEGEVILAEPVKEG